MVMALQLWPYVASDSALPGQGIARFIPALHCEGAIQPARSMVLLVLHIDRP